MKINSTTIFIAEIQDTEMTKKKWKPTIKLHQRKEHMPALLNFF